jgi:glycosyltransferase involved in cell wall biosynthesis
MIWVSHPFGNANVRSVIRGFYQRNYLSRFFTTIAFDSKKLFWKILPSSILSECSRKVFPVPRDIIRAHPLREICRQLLLRTQFRDLTSLEGNIFSAYSVWKSLDSQVSRCLQRESPPRIVYAYEDGALETFRMAKAKNIRRVYDLPIGYVDIQRKIFWEDVERLPEFKPLLEGIEDSSEKMERKHEEAALAELIISSSDFVTSTLIEAGFDKQKIIQVQFGAPENISPKKWLNDASNQPIRFLYVGRVTQRKGIGYLLKAFEEIHHLIAQKH